MAAPQTFRVKCGPCPTWSTSLLEPCPPLAGWTDIPCPGTFGNGFLPSGSISHATPWPHRTSPSQESMSTHQERFWRSCLFSASSGFVVMSAQHRRWQAIHTQQRMQLDEDVGKPHARGAPALQEPAGEVKEATWKRTYSKVLTQKEGEPVAKIVQLAQCNSVTG